MAVQSLIGAEVDNGEYRIVERIGTGGMGSVYKAEQPSMNRMVAIKVLHAKFADRHDLVARFRREARAMSQLSHPNTARVYKFGELPDGSAYFVMDYMQGRNLASTVREEGPMDAAPFVSPVGVFYMTDPISRASETMAQCVEAFALGVRKGATGTHG